MATRKHKKSGKAKPAPAAPQTTPPTADPGLDPHVAAETEAAYRAKAAGARLTDRQRRLIDRFENAREERDRWTYYRAIPRNHWLEMAATTCTWTTLVRRAAAAGITLGTPVDLTTVVRELSAYLARTPQPTGTNGQASGEFVDRIAEERYRILRNQRRRIEGELIPVSEAIAIYGLVADIIRREIERTEDRHGAEVAGPLWRAIDAAGRAVERQFGGEDESE